MYKFRETRKLVIVQNRIFSERKIPPPKKNVLQEKTAESLENFGLSI